MEEVSSSSTAIPFPAPLFQIYLWVMTSRKRDAGPRVTKLLLRFDGFSAEYLSEGTSKWFEKDSIFAVLLFMRALEITMSLSKCPRPHSSVQTPFCLCSDLVVEWIVMPTILIQILNIWTDKNSKYLRFWDKIEDFSLEIIVEYLSYISDFLWLSLFCFKWWKKISSQFEMQRHAETECLKNRNNFSI